MSHTLLSIRGEKFYINGSLVYGEIPGCPESSRGLLMNARFIQGIFDDAADVSRFHRFLRRFDPEENTDALIAALPRWYDVGLRAFTVGFQGGGPCFTIDNSTIDNNGFSRDGLSIKPAYAARMARLLDAADRLGFAVIVSLFYAGQIARLDGAQAVLNAVRTACTFLRLGGWKNIILEVANEYDIPPFKPFPLIQTAQGMVALIDLARRESGLPVGSSGGGGTVEKEVIEASDVVFFHGNGQPRQQMVRCIQKIRHWAPQKPIVCNEDSQALSNLQVCVDHGVSWGYYNNLTKQEPPADWTITQGEDTFFAHRMAKAVGIVLPPLGREGQFLLMGLGEGECTDGKCFPRMASLYPEQIDYVDFYRDGKWLERCYDDPFTLHYLSNWLQQAHTGAPAQWRAVATLRTGETVERTAKTAG